MTIDPAKKHYHDFRLVQAGPTHHIGRHLGIVYPPIASRVVRMFLLILITWLPIVIIAYLSGDATRGQVKVPLWHDPEVHCRFLLALPLLSLAEALISVGLSAQVRHLFDSGIIPASEHDRFLKTKDEVVRVRENPWLEVVFFVVAFVCAFVLRVYFFDETDSTWERHGRTVTPAGWWYILVGLPILFFFLIRSAGIFTVWSWFLLRISRMDLQLTSTHPDRAGGLGFLGWGLACFSPVLFSFSTVMSAGFAYEIFHRGESLDSLKYHLAVYVVLALAILHLPLFAFSMRLSRCRFAGLLEFSALVWRYDRAFDEKWIQQPQDQNQESLLGSADVQSLADIATAYEHAEQMWLLPLDTKALTVFAVAALLPMTPLIGTAIPLQDIISKLGEFLV